MQILSAFTSINDEEILGYMRDNFSPPLVVIQTPSGSMVPQEFPLRRKYDIIKKKVKIENINYNVMGIEIRTDLQYNPQFFGEQNRILNVNKQNIINHLIDLENQKRIQISKERSILHRQLSLWFHSQDQQITTDEKSITSKSALVVKTNDEDGIQVTGTIVTKQGYKITYPNLAFIIKATDIPEQVNNVKVIRQMKPMSFSEMNQMDDLKYYVWRIKQYKQFFRLVLKKSINNIEISLVLPKIAEKMRTGFYHVQTFYHISNKSWSIHEIIKDLNKKNLFARERTQLYEVQINNKQDSIKFIFTDLDLLFKPYIEENNNYYTSEEQLISFSQYRKSLTQLLQDRAGEE